MSPRTGRPHKDNARNCKLNIRLTVDELAQIQVLADVLHMTRTDAIMFAVQQVSIHFCGDN